MTHVKRYVAGALGSMLKIPSVFNPLFSGMQQWRLGRIMAPCPYLERQVSQSCPAWPQC